MILQHENSKPVLRETVHGSEVTIRFADKPQSGLKDTVIEILTSCYESRIQEVFSTGVASSSISA